MNKLLSVIIPVYNGYEYIDKCLNSIIDQTYGNLEIIVINDGSKDHSLEKLNYYASLDKRIRVIDQKNQGSSKTRENGISLATGEYITFVDIDDFIENNAYQLCMDKINDNDILVFGISCDYESEGYSIIRKADNSIASMFENEIFNFVWNKVFKSELIKNKNYFPTDFNQGEDLIFNCKTFLTTDKYIVIDDVLYHYVYRQKDTMITKYTKDNDIVLSEKKRNVYNLLNDSQTYYDYILKEYEVFTINLFMKNNDLSFSDKVKMIKNNLLSDIKPIKYGRPNNLYGKIFKVIASSHSAIIVVICYFILNVLKNVLGGYYLMLRRLVYKK